MNFHVLVQLPLEPRSRTGDNAVYGSLNPRVMATNGPEASQQEKVRVLSVIGSLRFGGAEARVARFAQALRPYGIETEICALERTGPNLTLLENAGFRVHGTPYLARPFRSNTMMLLRTVDAIRRIVKAGRFDIVHTNLFWADVLGVAGARLGGCRRIIQSRVAMHSWAHGPTAFFHGLEQTTNALTNELIADCQASLKDAERYEALLPSKRTVIYSGVEIDQFPVAHPRLDGTLRLLTLGVLAPRKGQEFAIQAMEILKTKGVDAKLQLVGSGPDEAMLRQQVLTRGLGEIITFVGQVPDSKPFFADADMFIFPSRQEGGAIALQEAMASALPIVATDVGGVPEALVDGSGGRLVPPQDAAALARAISDLASDRARLQAMGQFNRRRAIELYSLDVSAGQLADWYKNPPSIPKS